MTNMAKLTDDFMEKVGGVKQEVEQYEGHDPVFSQVIDTNKHQKCAHTKLEAISGSEVRCKTCGAGWIGANVTSLLKSQK